MIRFSKSFIVSFGCCFIILLLANCAEPKDKIVNRDPNGNSELQLTMREMYDYFEDVKKDIKAGKEISDIKAFEHIMTDIPTEEGVNKTALYETMSSVYFNAVQSLNSKKDQESFKQVVDACMACHRQVCPGPMVKIKKLYN